MANTYIVYNGALVTTTAFVPVTTSTSLKTLLQLKPQVPIEIVEWGISFDGSSAATPGVVELLETGTVAATVTAYATGDVQPFNDPNAPANTSGTSGTPLNLGTTHSGYSASGEGTITTTRMADIQQIAGTNQYVKQFPLGEQFKVPAGNIMRVRVKFGTAVNAICYVVFRV